jgi:hypothetical protein
MWGGFFLTKDIEMMKGAIGRGALFSISGGINMVLEG